MADKNTQHKNQIVKQLDKLFRNWENEKINKNTIFDWFSFSFSLSFCFYLCEQIFTMRFPLLWSGIPFSNHMIFFNNFVEIRFGLISAFPLFSSLLLFLLLLLLLLLIQFCLPQRRWLERNFTKSPMGIASTSLLLYFKFFFFFYQFFLNGFLKSSFTDFLVLLFITCLHKPI